MSLHLEVLTPSGSVVDMEAEEVNVPAHKGEVGILDGHLPFLASLKPGVLRYRLDDKWHFIAIGEGFVEVGAHRRVLVLTGQHALPGNIDVDLAQAELKESQEALARFVGAVDVIDEDSGQWVESASHEALREKNLWAQACIDTALSAKAA